jgi:hypothetical protein
VRPEDIIVENGKLGLKTDPVFLCVIPADEDVSLYRRRKAVIVVQHSEGISSKVQLITTDGHPVNLTNLGTVISSLAKTPRSFSRLQKHLKTLGITIERKRE